MTKTTMDRATVHQTSMFEQQRPRLLRLAARILGDAHEAEDVVQNAWLRMDGAEGPPVGAWPVI